MGHIKEFYHCGECDTQLIFLDPEEGRIEVKRDNDGLYYECPICGAVNRITTKVEL